MSTRAQESRSVYDWTGGVQTIYTVGHSTLDFDSFVSLLDKHDIELLADIRSYPGSRRHPQFGKEAMSSALCGCGINYRWFPDLGGRRKDGLSPSPNGAWIEPSFRNFADWMLGDVFQDGIEKLLATASISRTAICCAEAVWWKCHRWLLSDFLTFHGHTVKHIMANGSAVTHTLSRHASAVAGRLVYPASLPVSSQGLLF